MKAALGTFVLGLGLFCAPPLRGAEFLAGPSGRHLLLKGQPFFWLADTAWLLAQVPSREDLELYLTTRKEQGFTVIQLTAVMGEERVWGTARPNALGDRPFVNDNPLIPAITPGRDPGDAEQYDYWDHLDYVLERVHAHGFRAAVVTLFVGHRGEGYQYLRTDNALQYGRFLGERYRSQPQIIWLLGGDNTPNTAEKKDVWNRVAQGIILGICGREDYSQTLMTYHINGGASSSDLWHEAPWLDFNMTQTWSEYSEIYRRVQSDYARTPAKPCGLGEGAYEDGPQYPTRPINDLVIRKQAYWSYFAGGYHTYGNGNVWHFDSLKAELTQPWRQALHSPGARQMKILREFFRSVDWPRFVPDRGLLAGSASQDAQQDCAMRTLETDGCIFYLSGARDLPLALPPASSGWTGKWVNPATGEERPLRGVASVARLDSPAGWSDALLYLRK